MVMIHRDSGRIIFSAREKLQGWPAKEDSGHKTKWLFDYSGSSCFTPHMCECSWVRVHTELPFLPHSYPTFQGGYNCANGVCAASSFGGGESQLPQVREHTYALYLHQDRIGMSVSQPACLPSFPPHLPNISEISLWGGVKK